MINVRNKRKYQGRGEYIGRPSLLGNPFNLKLYSRDQSIINYRNWLRQEYKSKGPVYEELMRLVNLYNELGELTLICWCDPLPCHGNVIKEAIDALGY